MTSLLDVNALISLLDANHEHHAAITGWFGQNNDRWASCPITQNGYLRIVTQERHPNRISIKEAIKTLSQAVSTPDHEFLSDDISLLDQTACRARAHPRAQAVADIYLLALSVYRGARFVTFDEGVSRVAVPQATNASVHVIRP